MKNQPNKIYLNLGFDPTHETDLEFKELDEVTWSQDKMNPYDLVYISEAYAEQERIKAKIEVLDEIIVEAGLMSTTPSRIKVIRNKIDSLKTLLDNDRT